MTGVYKLPYVVPAITSAVGITMTARGDGLLINKQGE